jgi:hypothetical protein
MGQSVPYSVSPLTPNGLNNLLYPTAINRIVPQDHMYGTDVWHGAPKPTVSPSNDEPAASSQQPSKTNGQFVLESMFSMSPGFNKADIKLIFGDGIMGQSLLD